MREGELHRSNERNEEMSMLPAQRNTWEAASDRDEDRRSRRQRLLHRIVRFASSPTVQQVQIVHAHGNISCIDLLNVADSSSDSGSELELFVDCAEPPNPTATATWGDLPEEVKMTVLGFCGPTQLVKLSAVNREFHRLCYDGQLWNTIDASEFYNRIPVAQLAQLIVSAGNFVRHLNLRGCVQLQKDWRVEAVANVCRNLVSASLEGCKFERSIVHFIIMRNPQLVHVNLSGLASVTNSTCRMLAQSCPLVQSLNVSFCTNADARGLKRVIESCRRLKELKACELHINDSGMMQALFKRNAMERLQLGDTTGVTDEHIRLLVEGVDPEIDPFTDRSTAPPRKLVHLDLGRCTLLTDNALRHLTDNVPNLQQLELGGVVSLTDAGLSQLLPTLPKLEHLDIEECVELSNTTLFNIARGPAAKTLKHLQISYCENMGDVGIKELLCKCESLWNLEMDNTRVSDFTLAEAARAIRQRPEPTNKPTTPRAYVAMRLVVFDCPNITWTGVREVLSRNTEHMGSNPSKPGVILLKCFYEYQKTVDEHTRHVLGRDVEKANMLEDSWAKNMMAAEEASAAAGGRRRGRRRDNNANGGWDGDRRRSPRGGACAIM